MIHRFTLFTVISLLSFFSRNEFRVNESNVPLDYSRYHQQVIEAEELIAVEKYQEALKRYEEVIKKYSFVFVREYMVATQLAVSLHQNDVAIGLLEAGIRSGWDKRSIRKNKYLSNFLKEDSVKLLMAGYENLRQGYEKELNDTLRNQVHDMFKRDQKLAMKALFKLSSSAQDNYAENKFAPNSEIQMHDLAGILEKAGYPGERIIGNNYWMSTILSHHNSISQAYVLADSLYIQLRPKLLSALKKGNMSPQEFALIDEWRYATLTNPTEVSYGFLKAPYAEQLGKTDSLRGAIGLRSVQLRNQLVEVEEKTGMDMYLFGSPWVDGKIEFK